VWLMRPSHQTLVGLGLCAYALCKSRMSHRQLAGAIDLDNLSEHYLAI